MMYLQWIKGCLLLVTLLSFQSLTADADIYSWTDEKGVLHFSNEPPPAHVKAKRDAELKHEAAQYEKWNEQRQNRQADILRQGRAASKSANKSGSPKIQATLNPGNVVMYVTPTCGYCKRAKSFFNRHNIAFTEYDITKDKNASQRFIELNGNGVPLILVGDRRIPGFNKPLLRKLFGIPKPTARP